MGRPLSAVGRALWGAMGQGLAVGQRCCGAALTGLCRGAAALLGFPGFPRAHALFLGALVALGPLLRGRGDPHSVLASPHNRLEARLTASAASWTWLLIGSLLVASQPWLRPPWRHALRALLRLAVGLGLSRAGHALGHALEAATGSCRQATPLGTLLLPLEDPAACRGAGHSWEGFSPAPQAFALVHCGLGLAEEAAALGRSLYGKMAAGGSKMAAGYGEGFKMAAGGSKMAAGYGEGFKMVAGYGEGFKMAAGDEMGEGGKMAAGFKMAAGDEMGEGSKMAAGFKMAPRFKMAAGYEAGERSKMAAGFKMAAGNREEGAKMAAGGGWAWPEAIWRPARPMGMEWAEPPHANYGWGVAGGHLGRPSWTGRGHLDDGRHFESGGHFEGGHFPRSGRHIDHPGRHLESFGSHFDHPGRRFESPGRHLDSFGSHLESFGSHFDSQGSHFDSQGSHFERPGGHFERPGGHFERSSCHFEHPGGHFAGSGGHFAVSGGHFASSGRRFGVGHLAGGHLEAPPVALSILYLLAVALLLTWHLLLVVTLTYRNTWARNAAGAALGWAAWALTYRGWYRWAWSPGPPGWG